MEIWENYNNSLDISNLVTKDELTAESLSTDTKLSTLKNTIGTELGTKVTSLELKMDTVTKSNVTLLPI